MGSRRGVLLLVVGLFVFGLMLMLAARGLRRSGAVPASRVVLTYDVPGSIDEDIPELDLWSPRSWRHTRIDLYELMETLRAAARDDRVRGVILHVGSLDWGWAQLAEFRESLQVLRHARKPVYVSLQSGGEPEYFLASAATCVALPPAANLELNGLSASAVFLKGTFDKLGVRPNFLRVGRYKSAPESYTRGDLSEPAREAMTALLGDTHTMLAESLATARSTVADSIRAWMDRGPYTATQALRLGLVDTLLDRSQLDSLAMRRSGRGAEPLRLLRYADAVPEARSLSRIALVTASGTIVAGKSRVSATGERQLGAETLVEALRRARTGHFIKAIVLRIDSPGGDAEAADEIWHEVAQCRRVKPVIVSMSDLAASGGYYIAAAADTIVAEPATITGSIGIFGGKFNVLGLYQKLGLNVESVSTGPRAQMYSPFRDFTDDEARIYQQQLHDSYERFLGIVADGRGRTREWADSVGQGRVWSGTAAADLGLVDLLGGLEAALQLARVRAGFGENETVAVERFPRAEPSLFERWLGDLWDPGDSETRLRPPVVDEPLRALESVAWLGSGAALALMPYTITIR